MITPTLVLKSLSTLDQEIPREQMEINLQKAFGKLGFVSESGAAISVTDLVNELLTRQLLVSGEMGLKVAPGWSCGGKR